MNPGWKFSQFIPPDPSAQPFDQLWHLFRQILLAASGDVSSSLALLTELDKQFKLTGPAYGIADFIEDLKKKGYVKAGAEPGTLEMTVKSEMSIRKNAFRDIFGKVRRSRGGSHSSPQEGKGDELTSDIKPFSFGENVELIDMPASLKNAQIRHGLEEFKLTEDDLEVRETYYQAQMSTVLMIDISHSMILYGEDRITPAKKVALALSEYIMTRFPKDNLDVIVFGDDAWQIEIKDLPYLEVGPFHTNTIAGLELAMALLQKRKNPNKQIVMITDGKPTCMKQGKQYYKNSYGLDRKIVNRTLSLAIRCRKLGIPITTFMIAQDPYLIRFVEDFTEANEGKAYYSSLNNLGEFILHDYKRKKMARR